MKVENVMSEHPICATPEMSLQQAARPMVEHDCGALPVVHSDGDGKPLGIITDRDITCRTVAAGKNPKQCKVGEVMSADVKYVFEDETTEDLARNMSTLQVRRLPVLNRDKRLVGIVSLGDLATAEGAGDETKAAIAGVSEKVA